MPVERLTAEDEVMLWPDEVWPQDIGALVVLDGSNLFDLDGRFRIEVVREAIASRLHLVPRFRQLLYVPPRRLGRPLWVDAPAVDLADHVAVLALPAPADEAALLRAVEQLRQRPLRDTRTRSAVTCGESVARPGLRALRGTRTRSRPLWEMWLLTGLPDRCVGLFVRLHHAIADGMAGVATIATFLDLTPGPTAGPAQPWTPTAR